MKLSKLLALVLAFCMVLSLGVFADMEPPEGDKKDEGVPAAEEAAAGVTPGTYTDGANTLVIADDFTFVLETAGEDMDGGAFALTVKGVYADGAFTITGVFDGDMDLTEIASEEQLAGNLATVEALAGAGAGEAAGGWDAWIEYLKGLVQPDLDIYDMVMSELDAAKEEDYTGMEDGTVFGVLAFSYEAIAYEDFAPAPAAGGTDEAAYQAYLCAFVDSCEDIQTSGAGQEFKDAINAGNYVDFPVEMLFDAQWFGEAAMTYDEFVAAGGAYDIAEHASNGAMLDGTGEE